MSAAHFLSGKHIIISGAGTAGPAFAIALSAQWTSLHPSLPPPTLTIYERDTELSSHQRRGYSLTVRSDPASGGMQALRKLGLLEEVLAGAVPGLPRFTIWDREWNVMFQVPDATPPDGLPVWSLRVGRWKLRGALIRKAEEGGAVVVCGVSCVSASVIKSGRVEVGLSDGETTECDLLIVADGAGSKLRGMLRPEDDLRFAGAVMINGVTRFEAQPFPDVLEKSFGSVVGGNGTSLFISKVDEKSVIWSVSYATDKPRQRVIQALPAQAEALLAEALKVGEVFQEPFPSLVRNADPNSVTVVSAMDKPPFAHIGSKPVVFIGDSNHAVSPFAGNGANMALRDGWDLAEQLCKSDSLEVALDTYDNLSMPRSRGAMETSHQDIALFHSIDRVK